MEKERVRRRKRLAAAVMLGVAGMLGGTLWFFVGMPGPRHRGPLTGVTDTERDLSRRLRAHVDYLAQVVGPRATAYQASLQRAVEYIEEQFRACGLTARRLPTRPDAFWQAGYPAVMVTDTSNFRNLHYHRATDTPDKLDFERMARVTSGLQAVVEHLAGPDPANAP